MLSSQILVYAQQFEKIAEIKQLMSMQSLQPQSHQSQMEMVAELNNMGIACIGCSDYSQASAHFRMALNVEIIQQLCSGSSNTSCIPPVKIDDLLVPKSMEVKMDFFAYNKADEYDEGMKTFLQPTAIPVNKRKNTTVSSSSKRKSQPQQQQQLSSSSCSFISESELYASLTTVLFNMALVYIRQDQSKLALEVLARALQACLMDTTTASNTYRISAVAILQNIGYLHYRNEEYDDAVKAYQKALDFGWKAHHKVVGDCSDYSTINNNAHNCCIQDIAVTLNCLGVVNFHRAQTQLQSQSQVQTQSDSQIQSNSQSQSNTQSQMASNKRRRTFLKLDSPSKRLRRSGIDNNSNSKTYYSYSYSEQDQPQQQLGQVDETIFAPSESSKVLDSALQNFVQSLTIRCAVGGYTEHEKPIATTLNNIGRVHFIKGDYEEAVKVFQEVLLLRRQLFGRDHVETAAAICHVALSQQKLGQYNEAMELFHEFVAIAKKGVGVKHRAIVRVLKGMAEIYQSRKENYRAKQLYEGALSVGKACLGSHDEEISSMLNKLGNILFEIHDFDSAIQVYKEGLEVERFIFDSYHPNIAVTLSNIGHIYNLRGQYEEALVYHEEALMIQQESLGHSNTKVAATLSSIALIHFQLGRHLKSFSILQEVLCIRRLLHGDDHLDVALTLNWVGLVLSRVGFHEWALQNYSESLKIRTKLLGKKHRDVAAVLYNIAKCYLEVNTKANNQNDDDNQALQYFQAALQTERSIVGDTHKDLVLPIMHIGNIYMQRGDYHNALQYYTDAMDIRNKLVLKRQQRLQKHVAKADQTKKATTTKSRTTIDNNNNDDANKCNNNDNNHLNNIQKDKHTNKNDNSQQQHFKEENVNDCFTLGRNASKIGKLHLMMGNTKDMVKVFSDAVRNFRKAGKSQEDSYSCLHTTINGNNAIELYSISKLHPECAQVA